MTDLRITGTSNLLNHKAWSVLTEDFEVDFGDFADWPSAMFADTERALLWVVFLEDLIAPEKAADVLMGSGEADLDIIFQPLIHRLDSSDSPTLVAFSTWRPESIVSQSRSKSIWRQFADSFSRALEDLMERHPSLLILDLDEVFSNPGLTDCFDSRNYYSFRCRLSSKGLNLLADNARKILFRITNPAKKVLAVDCDDTLWGGVLGDVGIAGISLGTDGLGMAFRDFQRSIQRWVSQGALLVILSKNDQEQVLQVFDRHPEMQISRSDVVAWRVDWGDKPSNLVAIANELGLGVDSFVFLDNSRFEREWMREVLPQVFTPELPDDVTTWPSLLDSMDDLARFTVSKEDSRKAEQYRLRSAFISDLTEADDGVTFLRSIAMRPETVPLSVELLPRAEQLCQKTNQFNLRTVRHTVTDLTEILSDQNCHSFLVSLTDRFGNHGMVGLVVAVLRSDVAFLDSFILSCRVLGRHLEAWVLHELMRRLRSENCGSLVAEFQPTERNVVAQSFLPDHGLARFEWKDSPPARPVDGISDLVGDGGQLYYADLQTVEVPHLEVFEL